MDNQNVVVCPKCGSTHTEMQVFQEQVSSQAITKTKSKYKEKKHGIFWWLFFGWWWWIVDLFIWIFAFIPRALLHIGRKKKYVGSSTSTTTTKNKIEYKSMRVCKDCGHHWQDKSSSRAIKA